MSDQNKENILYGGPEPQLIDNDFRSLGELLLKKLSTRGDNVMYVSMVKIYSKFDRFCSNLIFHNSIVD